MGFFLFLNLAWKKKEEAVVVVVFFKKIGLIENLGNYFHLGNL